VHGSTCGCVCVRKRGRGAGPSSCLHSDLLTLHAQPTPHTPTPLDTYTVMYALLTATGVQLSLHRVASSRTGGTRWGCPQPLEPLGNELVPVGREARQPVAHAGLWVRAGKAAGRSGGATVAAKRQGTRAQGSGHLGPRQRVYNTHSLVSPSSKVTTCMPLASSNFTTLPSYLRRGGGGVWRGAGGEERLVRAMHTSKTGHAGAQGNTEAGWGARTGARTPPHEA
jgi:hypothetical protein